MMMCRSNMDYFDVQTALENITILVDTREQDTPQARKRLEGMNLPYERQKLDFGDYSAKCKVSENEEIDFSDVFAVERKMSLDELCGCYCRSRERFTREFERAREKNAKLYLLIENGSYEAIINHRYRSRFRPNAFLASLTAWTVRYNLRPVFCKSETSGALIKEILYRDMKERLERGEYG